MSNYNSLKTTIDANIKQNGNQEITGQILNSVLNQMVTTLGAGYQFAGVATLDPATDPGTPDAKVFYIANGKGTYTNFGGINVTEDEVVVLYWDSSWHKVSTGIASHEKLTELESETNTNLTKVRSDLVAIENAIQDINGDNLYISDSKGNVIAKITNKGIESVDIAIAGGKKLSEVPNDILEDFYKKQLYISDDNGNIILHIDESGHLHYLDDDKYVLNDWKDKTLSTYGDSVTAVNNGNFKKPYKFESVADSWNWGNRVAEYFNMEAHYGRGVGSQGYKWTTAGGNGGSVTFVNATTGAYTNRDNNYNYDNYTGAIPEGCVKVRGCLASWSRITSMYPASIKDSIDVILVMAHNDAYDASECAFVPNDTTDTEWAASGADYYGKINGDYDLSTLKGGIASTLMKLQLWMPNAIIVLMTGISGQGTTGELNENINGGLTKTAQAIREMSHLTSIPCIDTFATDGINGWNRTSYIADSIHPYTIAGSKMFARAVIGGLKSILPNI